MNAENFLLWLHRFEVNINENEGLQVRLVLDDAPEHSSIENHLHLQFVYPVFLLLFERN